MIKHILLRLVLACVVLTADSVWAQTAQEKTSSASEQTDFDSMQADAPGLEFVMEIRAICDPAYEVGLTPKGRRVVIPITGGSFEGPKLRGTVLNGGADYQLIDDAHQRTELEAIYSIRTDDGVNIHVRNRGILSTAQGFYFRCSPIFEAPYDSPYAWLNDAIFVCVPEVKNGYVSLKMFRVLPYAAGFDATTYNNP